MSYEFYNPTRVLFGAGQLNHLHEQKMVCFIEYCIVGGHAILYFRLFCCVRFTL